MRKRKRKNVGEIKQGVPPEKALSAARVTKIVMTKAISPIIKLQAELYRARILNWITEAELVGICSLMSMKKEADKLTEADLDIIRKHGLGGDNATVINTTSS